MPILNGSKILIAIDDGSPPPVVIPCQVTASYSLSREARDTSCKDSPDDSNEPGSASRSCSVETLAGAWPMLVDAPTAADQILRKAAEVGTQITSWIMVEGVAVEEFDATITSYEISAPREDNTTVSLELQISGPMRPVEESS